MTVATEGQMTRIRERGPRGGGCVVAAQVSGPRGRSEGITARAVFIAPQGGDCTYGALSEKLSGATGRQGGGQHCRGARRRDAARVSPANYLSRRQRVGRLFTALITVKIRSLSVDTGSQPFPASRK